MILHSCDECGDNCRTSFRIMVHVQTSSTEHADQVEFCPIGCLTDWAAENGHRDVD